jgi:iron-sulfur cluster repair protein YtfE (RIC family)
MMKPENERFTAKTTVLIENVEHHMEEEEQEWFPKVRAGVGRKELQDMGQRMIDRRPSAPRTPTEPAAVKSAADAVRA